MLIVIVVLNFGFAVCGVWRNSSQQMKILLFSSIMSVLTEYSRHKRLMTLRRPWYLSLILCL